jgi:hypothetical protein
MMSIIQKSADEILDMSYGELNDSITRKKISNNLLEVFGYKVVCDETNNPPEVIDRNELRADLFIPELRIILDITISSHGAVTTIVPMEEFTPDYK